MLLKSEHVCVLHAEVCTVREGSVDQVGKERQPLFGCPQVQDVVEFCRMQHCWLSKSSNFFAFSSQCLARHKPFCKLDAAES